VPIPNKSIGPLQPRFNRNVARYIANSPTHQQRVCLRNFFQSLSKGRVRVPCKEIEAGKVFLVGTCGHTIQFKSYGARVHSIDRGALS
jgi:hypothetical protein